MKRAEATIVREYGPFPNVSHVHGVSFDGKNIWIATGNTLNAIDPESGNTVRELNVLAHAGTAFDGRYLFQISGDRIQKVDPDSGRVVSSIPTPASGASGMAWAEGTLWIGQHRNRKIHQIDPQSGAILRTIESNRFVTGVTWVDGDLRQRLHQEVGRTHPCLDRSERMLDRLAPLAHGVRVGVEPLLNSFEHMLMLPSRNSSLRPGRALSA